MALWVPVGGVPTFRAAFAVALVAAVAVAGASVGGDTPTAQGRAAGSTLTIYSSLPLQGAQRLQTTAIVRGEQMALKEAGGRAGSFGVRLVSLDDSTKQAGTWTPEAVARNARKVAGDKNAIAYLGEFNSGASAISMPILNNLPLAQISPGNTAIGLTRRGPGAGKGEPRKYVPTHHRTYTRIVPNDRVQAAALGALIKRRHCKRAFYLNDGEVYGRGIATLGSRAARRRGVRTAGSLRIRPRSKHFGGLASRVRRSGARCVLFGGVTSNGAVPLSRALVRTIPGVKIFVGDGVSNPEFFVRKEGGVGASIGRHVTITVATLSPASYPAAGRAFFARYKAAYGAKTVDPYAIYGYESMSLALDAIRRAGAKGNQPRAVVKALFATHKRKSVLGSYSIDKFGDTTQRRYGVYGIRGGQLRYTGSITP